MIPSGSRACWKSSVWERLRVRTEADVLVFNTCTIREKPDQRLAAHLAQARALKQHDPDRVWRSGGCYAEAQRGAAVRALSVRGRCLRHRARSHTSASGSAPEGVGVTTRQLRALGSLCRRAPGAARAAIPGLGTDLDGLQLGLFLLHRAGRAGARAEPTPRGDPGGGRAPCLGRGQGDHAPRPERELLGSRSRAEHAH